MPSDYAAAHAARRMSLSRRRRRSTMTRAFKSAGTALIAFALATGAEAQTTLTFSTWVPLNHPISTYIFNPWFEQVEKDSGGALAFRTLPKPIAAPNQHYDAVVKGQVDVAYATYGYQPERFKPYLIAELPQLGETAVHNGVALWRIHQKHYASLPIHQDVYLIGVMTHGPGLMHHSKKPIMLPDDLKGQKIRVGTDVSKLIVQHFGGVVITQPAPKSYEILSGGIADGIFFPMESLKSFNIAKLVTHTTYVKGGLYSSGFWFGMNKEKFNSLPKAAKDAIVKNGGEVFARMAGKGWDRADEEGLKLVRENNNTYREAAPEFVAKLNELTAKIEADYAADLDKLGLKGKQIIAEFRAEVERVKSGN
jgi:TRAP-type C4-dicarboxylate transport system substrate-binding protein